MAREAMEKPKLIICDPLNDRIWGSNMEMTMTPLLNEMDFRDKHWCYVPMNKSGKMLGIVYSHLVFENAGDPKTLVMYGMAVYDVRTNESLRTVKRKLRQCATQRWFKCPGMCLVGMSEFVSKERKQMFLNMSRGGGFKGPRHPKRLWAHRMIPAKQTNGKVVTSGFLDGIWENAKRT